MTESNASRHLALAGQSPLTQPGAHVLCLTPVDQLTEAAFSQALEMAAPDGVVVLYDRRDESWRPDDDALLTSADDEAFVDVEDIRRAGAAADASAAGLAVWRSITPALGTGIVQAVQVAEITDIVLPAKGHREGTGDALLGDDDSLAAAVAALLEKPVLADAGISPQLHLVDADES